MEDWRLLRLSLAGNSSANCILDLSTKSSNANTSLSIKLPHNILITKYDYFSDQLQLRLANCREIETNNLLCTFPDSFIVGPPEQGSRITYLEWSANQQQRIEQIVTAKNIQQSDPIYADWQSYLPSFPTNFYHPVRFTCPTPLDHWASIIRSPSLIVGHQTGYYQSDTDLLLCNTFVIILLFWVLNMFMSYYLKLLKSISYSDRVIDVTSDDLSPIGSSGM